MSGDWVLLDFLGQCTPAGVFFFPGAIALKPVHLKPPITLNTREVLRQLRAVLVVIKTVTPGVPGMVDLTWHGFLGAKRPPKITRKPSQPPGKSPAR